ncbi:MAG TPA: hypothetical protein VFU02_14225 [Polyangiaceae bacterium]|nr:hypothetical protein [Polyangiaceae bacterium]
MTAQHAAHTDFSEELLDADTSAALMRWLETGSVPDGVDAEQWEAWADAGCQGSIQRNGNALSPAMLGHWARTGSLS